MTEQNYHGTTPTGGVQHLESGAIENKGNWRFQTLNSRRIYTQPILA